MLYGKQCLESNRYLFFIAVAMSLFVVSFALAGQSLAAADEMDNAAVQSEITRAWADQAQDVYAPSDGSPYLSGSFVWNSRADHNYKAFFQWEMKLHAGDKAVENVQIRAIPLDAEMQVQFLFRGKREAPWKDVASLAAGSEREISYKLNCSNIAGYRIELKWGGGKKTLFAGTRYMLPINAQALEKQPFVAVSDVDFKYKKSSHAAMVSYFLTNVGGAVADEVQQTIDFVDESGKTVHTAVNVPEKGSIKAGYAKKQQAVFKKVPDFANVVITTKQKQILTYQLDGDQLVAKEDIGLSHLSVDDKAIGGTITNGFKNDVAQLVVTINFEDQAAQVIKKIDVHIAALKAGASTTFTQSIDAAFAFKAYSISYQFSAPE